MANGKNAILRCLLDGVEIDAPVEWASTEVLATFDKDIEQGNLDVKTDYTFVLQGATMLRQRIASGMTGGVGITEGVPFKEELHNNANQVVVFDGMIDLTENCLIDEFSNKVTCKLKLRDELYSLEEKLQCLTFGYLEGELNLFTNSSYTDIQYIVQKKNNIIETIIMAVTLYIMTKELIDAIVKIVKDVGLVLADATGGIPMPTAIIAGIILGIVIIIIEILYAALLLIAIINLSSTLLNQLIPIKRKAKGITYKTAMSVVCTHLGYGFVSNINDLNVVCYIPSNYSFDTTTSLGILDQWKGNAKGIPSSSDYGYFCADFFEIARKLFKGKFAILNGAVHFHNVDDPFWITQSTYQMPQAREALKYSYNLDELKANILLTHDVDFSDEFTIDDYQGNSYEVITTQIVSTDPKLVQVKGLEEIRFGVCMGSRKNEVTGFENFLLKLADVVDGIITTFGGQAQYVQMINTSVGLMRISTNNWTKPKVVKVDGNKRLVTRSLWSAKYIWETYYIGSSFCATVNGIPFYGQKKVFKNIKIGFGLNNFVELMQNSNFVLPNGSTGKITRLPYRFSSDSATIDYYIRTPFTKNLKETYIEPTNQ